MMMNNKPNLKKQSKIKDLEFVGDSLDNIKVMPRLVQQKIGYALHKVQCGETPKESKPLKGIAGVAEIIARFDTDTFRAVYIAEIKSTVYVLHAFKKKSKSGIKTPKSEINLVKQRLKKAYEESEK